MSGKPIGRRSLLQMAGGATAAALIGPRAFALSPPQPKRLLVIFTSDGTIHDAWRPTGSQTDFTLGRILAPLAALQSDMIVLDGVRRLTRGSGDGHEQGMTQILTGRPNESGATRSTGPSIDEFVNGHIGEGRSALRLGVLSQNYVSNWTRMTFGENGNPLDVESNPYEARDRLFDGFTPGGSGPSPDELRRRAIREAALGYAENRVSRLAGAASAIDRADLLTHAQSIARLRAAPPPSTTALCTLERIDQWQSGLDAGEHDNFPQIARMQMELISAAFACDRARVAVLQFSMSNSEVYHKWANADAEHHGLSHYEFGYSDPFRTEALTSLYEWFATQIAWLLGDLKASGLLDDTVVLWTSEMGEGRDHSDTDIPMVLIGSGGGHFTTGRYMDYRGTGHIPDMTGVSHCDVLVSICNAMGIETDTFGEAASCYGPLSGVT
jgi:hypothetical protein